MFVGILSILSEVLWIELTRQNQILHLKHVLGAGQQGAEVVMHNLVTLPENQQHHEGF